MTDILTQGTDKHRRADIAPGATHRLDGPAAGRTAPMQPRAQRGQHLHHVSNQIVGPLTGIEHHQPATGR